MQKMIIMVTMFFVVGYAFAVVSQRDLPAKGMDSGKIHQPAVSSNIPNPKNRIAPSWSFSILPEILLESYYDYMIGGINNCPLHVNPNQNMGGYFLTYHAKRSPLSPPASNRRVFYSYIDNAGDIQINNEITAENNWEGYPSMDVDPVSGMPLYAWHAQLQTSSDPYDVQFGYYTLLSGFVGLMSEPVVVIDNYITLPAPYNTADNEYIWTSVQIGPSPTAGMRRVYVLARNRTGHNGTTSVSGNARIAYADFNTDMLIEGTQLVWDYTSIPELDDWNHDNVDYRKPNYAFTVGDDGRIYYMGYHTAGVVNPASEINEPDMDVFVCDNFGQGTWQRFSAYSTLPSWNPATNFGEGIPFMEDSAGVPITDYPVYWKIGNSGHLNAVIDNNDVLHCTALWNLGWNEDGSGYYVTTYNTIKEMVFNANTNQFSIREIYPIAGTSSDSLVWQPWDTNADGEVDSYNTNVDDPAYGFPNAITNWNYPYWDKTVHNNAMFFHYNNLKVTKPNAQGWMAAVWQNSERARQYNDELNEAYSQYANVPEIYISTSLDYGVNWSEPIIINSVEVPEFADNTPMWVYPADVVQDMGMVDGHPTGRLAMMYFDDNTWGSYELEGPVGFNDGGNVKFMAIDIDFTPPVTPLVTVTGTVLGGNPPIALSDAQVSLNGFAAYSANTDSQGNFTINNVISGYEYSYSISKSGYVSFTGQVNVPSTDFNMGTISLNELVLPPSEISAEVLEGNNVAEIHWGAPIFKANAMKATGKADHLANTKDRLLMSYCIWRLEQGMEANPSAWVMIGIAFSNEYSIQDAGWSLLPQGIYRYAVQASYPDDQLSEAIFSAEVHRYTYGSVTGYVSDRNGSYIHNALLIFNRVVAIGQGPYSITTDENGVFTADSLWYGNYNLECAARNYQISTLSDIRITETQDISIHVVLDDSPDAPIDVNATVNASKSVVTISWESPRQYSQRYLTGFRIWRLLAADVQNPPAWTEIPGVIMGTNYQDTDWASLANGLYKFAVVAVYAGYLNSEIAFSNSVYNDYGLKYNRIISCYPSPFSISTRLSFAVKGPCNVQAEIFNLHGQLIRTLYKKDNIQGINFLSWDATNKQGHKVPSGMYLIKLKANGKESYKKVVVLK